MQQTECTGPPPPRPARTPRPAHCHARPPVTPPRTPLPPITGPPTAARGPTADHLAPFTPSSQPAAALAAAATYEAAALLAAALLLAELARFSCAAGGARWTAGRAAGVAALGALFSVQWGAFSFLFWTLVAPGGGGGEW